MMPFGGGGKIEFNAIMDMPGDVTVYPIYDDADCYAFITITVLGFPVNPLVNYDERIWNNLPRYMKNLVVR